MKIADFGFAKFTEEYDNEMMSTVVGTPYYMAP